MQGAQRTPALDYTSYTKKSYRMQMWVGFIVFSDTGMILKSCLGALKLCTLLPLHVAGAVLGPPSKISSFFANVTKVVGTDWSAAIKVNL